MLIKVPLCQTPATNRRTSRQLAVRSTGASVCVRASVVHGNERHFIRYRACIRR